jgi:predicted amidohydrolase YtcJ
VNHRDETGRIAPGMLADLAASTATRSTRPTGEIRRARAAATYVGGTLVYVRDLISAVRAA